MSLTICEVGPRDGLQNHGRVLSVAVRAELVERLAVTGVPCIEAVSFVHPQRVPAMAAAEEVLALAQVPEPTRMTALVLNERGFERLRATPLAELRFTFAVSDTFNRRNANASAADGRAAAIAVTRAARARGLRTAVVLATSFGCPFEGEVDPGRVLDIARRAAEAGAEEVVFADTIGVAVPRQVTALLGGAADVGRPLGLHLHDTRNTAVACAHAGLGAGATVFDASVGGLGGCPFAPRATGNVATEDLVYLLHREGIDTGIDLDALIEVAQWIAGVLGRELPGSVSRAGSFPPA
jgi:hydroxymethylglutaryl-CoA lyase/(R)-citramalyl-CoA lyase